MGRPAHPARLEAIADGRATYITGLPCKLGMIAERTVSGNKCQCEAHRAKRAENANARYKTQRDARLEKQRRYAKENVDTVRKNARNWASKNAHKVKANTHKRRARKLNATPAWFGEFDELVMQEAHELARRRKVATGIEWEVDHIVPLAGKKVCGLHVGVNIQVIPRTQNRAKSNKHAVQ